MYDTLSLCTLSTKSPSLNLQNQMLIAYTMYEWCQAGKVEVAFSSSSLRARARSSAFCLLASIRARCSSLISCWLAMMTSCPITSVGLAEDASAASGSVEVGIDAASRRCSSNTSTGGSA